MNGTIKPRTLSLITGFSYWIIFFAAVFANFFVIESMLSDPLRTIQHDGLLVRAGILAFMVTVLFDVVVAWALYALFKGELCHLQEWVRKNGLRVIVLFEGRDAAGKGGVIKRITERVSPRVFRTVALPAPSDREKTQLYIQRYVQHFPAAGEVVLFDRSWYNRAGVERVMGFCTPEECADFLRRAPFFEKYVIDQGITRAANAGLLHFSVRVPVI